MAFQINHKEASGGILPEGEYEVIVKNAHIGATNGGAPCINFQLAIRNDCGQAHAGYTIYDSLYQRREPTPADLAVDGFSAKQIQALSKAAGLADGKRYSGIDEWADDLVGRLLRVTIRHEDYNGKTRARVQWRNETRFPDCKHVWTAADLAADCAAGKAGFTELGGAGDDDAPF